jgi:hypothetical protein
MDSGNISPFSKARPLAAEEKSCRIGKVLFYTNTARAFRSTLIGHLYEIANAFPVVLLSEELDSHTENLLRRRNLFPKLKDIIPVRQFSDSMENAISRNRRLYRSALQSVEHHVPDVVISSSDMHSLFEMYLLRTAKKNGALTVCIQPTFMDSSARTSKWVDMVNMHTRVPSFVPDFLRPSLIRIRKYAGHFLYHWLYPLSIPAAPLPGKSSYVLRRGNCAMRDGDFYVVFSRRDYEICVQDGVLPERLCILRHPLQRPMREFFREHLACPAAGKINASGKMVTLLLPEDDIAFRASDFSVISTAERWTLRKDIVGLVSEILKDWKIFIKPHPNISGFDQIRKEVEAISGRIEFVPPADSVDPYLEASDLVVELPRSASTATFSASLVSPPKPVFSLDFDHEYLGDCFKDFSGIDYIEDRADFIRRLASVRDGDYFLKFPRQVRTEEREPSSYTDTVSMLIRLFQKHVNRAGLQNIRNKGNS